MGRITQEDVAALLQIQDSRCRYCRTSIADAFTFDHMIPLSRGGVNWPWNIALACRPCNQAKWKSTPSEWLGRDDY